MACHDVVFLIYSMCFIINVDAMATCNQDIINNILSTNNLPTTAGVLSKIQALSPFTYTLNPKGSVPANVKCVNGQVDVLNAPFNNSANAIVTVYYADTKMNPLKKKYFQQDLGSGHIKEIDDQNYQFQIYVLGYDLVYCYYHCTTYKTEGPDFGACAAPISKINDPQVKAAIKECKSKLIAVGITGDLVDLVPCATNT